MPFEEYSAQLRTQVTEPIPIKMLMPIVKPIVRTEQACTGRSHRDCVKRSPQCSPGLASALVFMAIIPEKLIHDAGSGQAFSPPHTGPTSDKLRLSPSSTLSRLQSLFDGLRIGKPANGRPCLNPLRTES